VLIALRVKAYLGSTALTVTLQSNDSTTVTNKNVSKRFFMENLLNEFIDDLLIYINNHSGGAWGTIFL